MNNRTPQNRSSAVRYMKYAGMAFQLFVLLAVTAWAGQKADAYFGTSKDYITAALILFVTFAYMYKLYIDLMKSS